MRMIRHHRFLIKVIVLFTAVLLPSFGLAQTLPSSTSASGTVVLGALDKITARVSTLKTALDTPVQFGTLEITVRYCRSNPPEQPPETVAFLEIYDVGHDKTRKQAFTGWMFASSPALSSLEHPVYDIWVVSCSIVSGPAPMGNE